MAPRPPAPRKRRSPEQARALILEAADRLIQKHGPDAVGLKRIAAEAGVSHALVSHYFGTYDALVEETFRAHVTRTRERLLARMTTAVSEGPETWLALFAEEVADPAFARMAAWALLSGRIDKSEFFSARDRGLRATADAVEHVIAARGGRKPPRETLELALVHAVAATLGYVLARPVLWTGLGKRPSAELDAAFRARLGRMLVADLGVETPHAAPTTDFNSSVTDAPKPTRRAGRRR